MSMGKSQEGMFAKVKFARNSETGENVAIKILDKEKVLKHKMIGQIKCEISTMKLIKHPNVIRMFEVMASKTNYYRTLLALQKSLAPCLALQKSLAPPSPPPPKTTLSLPPPPQLPPATS